MWAALLTVATLSLLTSSAFAAYATYRYFTSEKSPTWIALAYPLLSPTRQYGSTWMSMKFDGAPPASTSIRQQGYQTHHAEGDLRTRHLPVDGLATLG